MSAKNIPWTDLHQSNKCHLEYNPLSARAGLSGACAPPPAPAWRASCACGAEELDVAAPLNSGGLDSAPPRIGGVCGIRCLALTDECLG